MHCSDRKCFKFYKGETDYLGPLRSKIVATQQYTCTASIHDGLFKETFKILTGKERIECSKFFELEDTTSGLREHWEHSAKLHQQRCCTTVSQSTDQPHGTVCHQRSPDMSESAFKRACTEDAPVLDRPAPLKRFHDSGAGNEYPDLLTYLTVRQHLFSSRVINCVQWNKLSQAVLEAPSADAFKNRLDKH